MNRMEIFRKHFPADDPNYGDAMIDSAEVIDGEYLSGTFDWYLDECGYKPEDIGVWKRIQPSIPERINNSRDHMKSR